MFQDVVGRDLTIGDKVVITYRKKPRLYGAQIIGFSEKKTRVVIIDGEFKGKITTRDNNQLARI